MPIHTSQKLHSVAGAAADKAENTKEAKYRQLANNHNVCYTVAVETAGTWNHLAVELIQELGRRISAVTQDTRETRFLLQRLSVCGFTTGKCGLLPQHLHHTINVDVVIYNTNISSCINKSSRILLS